MQDSYIGVDVSKAELVISHDQLRLVSIPNDLHSITAWLAGVPDKACIAMESTGCYHRLLAQLASQAGLRVYVLNARDVFFYARALGTRAKSDGVDCIVIRRYLLEHQQHLHPWQAGTEVQQQLQVLLTRRAQVSQHQGALRQTLKAISLPGEHIDQLNRSFKELLKAIDDRVEALIASDRALRQGNQRLQSITGIGPQTGALLTGLFSRIAFSNADAVVAYSGLDPRANDSGKKRGRRRLSKRGPALLRRQMYLAGFAASHSKALKPLYEHIRVKGFSTTEAMVILGRKLLRIAFALWKGADMFDASRLLPKTCGQKT